MDILTADLIKQSEEKAVLSGAFSFLKLMNMAGTAAFDIISEKIDITSKKIAVFCGIGNNGGDGFVIAKLLFEHGADVTVFTPLGEPKTENAKHYFKLLPCLKKSEKFSEASDFDIIIDAIFGIGLTRNIESDLDELITKINNHKAFKISIDVPSGINSDTGAVMGVALKADLTITFIALKPCFLLPIGNDYCGELVVADIGVLPSSFSYKAIDKPLFKKRLKNSHKGTYGTALLINGSYGMAGAAMLSAKAALRSGAGIVKCVVCENIYSAVTSFLPEAVCIPTPHTKDGQLSYTHVDINDLQKNASALLFGCGVGVSNSTEKLLEKIIKNVKIPLVIDADGINLLSKSIELLKESKAPIILTPHPKEMSRLCKKSVSEIEENRIEISRNFAKENNVIVVLKGANTVVALQNGEILINTHGNSGMATAGSGDVLSGIIVSLLAQGYSPEFSAIAGVYNHSIAGDKAVMKRSKHSLIASDIIEEL